MLFVGRTYVDGSLRADGRGGEDVVSSLEIPFHGSIGTQGPKIVVTRAGVNGSVGADGLGEYIVSGFKFPLLRTVGMDGRQAVLPDDVQAVLPAVAGHRLRSGSPDSEAIVAPLLNSVAVS